MTSNALDEEVRAFFQTYTAAFEALDVEAIADCVAYPSHIASDGEEVLLIAMADTQQCLAAIDSVLTLLPNSGPPTGLFHDLSITVLSPRLVQASCQMEVLDKTSSHLYDFQAISSLAKFSGAWRIVAIAHNQIPRLLNCVSQRQSGP